MAIFNGTIRVRRGLESDFDESKMVSGELAIATDKPVIWFCWKDGTAAKIEGTVTSETLKKYFDEWNGDSNILIDETLSKTGQAADAKVTGDKFNELASDIENIGNPTDEQISNAVNSYMDNNPITITETDPTVPEWAKQPQKPTYTASEVGAEASGTAERKVSEHNISDTAHNDIRLLVQGLTERINALADSDDTTLDQMSEIVSYIKYNRSIINGINTNKVDVSDIVNNLISNNTDKPLSAKQGRVLKSLIDEIIVPTKLSELENDSGYAKTTDIPDKLPNPQKLTFAGAVTAEYDGSGAVTVTIPSGGAGGSSEYELLCDRSFDLDGTGTPIELSLPASPKGFVLYLGIQVDSPATSDIMTFSVDGATVPSYFKLFNLMTSKITVKKWFCDNIVTHNLTYISGADANALPLPIAMVRGTVSHAYLSSPSGDGKLVVGVPEKVGKLYIRAYMRY